MSLEQISGQMSTVSSEQLDHLESIWLSGAYPDIAGYLYQSAGSSGFLCGLVELDLEYRWRRYRKGVSMESQDQFGFPLFPQLEDYAKLLDESDRPQIMNPQLLAEEYRVRQFWGDHPSRRQFLDRIPEQSHAIELALAQIDTEFEVEGMTPLDAESISSIDEESTLLNHLKQATSEISIPSPNIGKYQLKSLLGRGGFGEVWRAYDPSLKRHIALKFPRPERKFSPVLLDYFRREAQKMAALEQVPGVVPVYEAGESNGVPYIVSFLVEGKDLGARFKEGSLTLDESVRIVADVAETLHRAHLSNLFHRDVKLSNILVNREGRAYLSDFGLCVSEEEQLHESHSATGTYAYMSPEQIQGQSHRVDGRADIYSLGVVLYRLITNRLPYIAETQAEYMDQVLHREPRPPRSIDDQLPSELERICLKCLKKNIAERYTTAGDLAEELRAWLCRTPAGNPPTFSSVPVESPARTSPSRTPQLLTIIAVCCLLAGGILVSIFRPPVDDSSSVQPVAPPVDLPDETREPATALPDDSVLVMQDVSPFLSNGGIWFVRKDPKVVQVFSDLTTMKALDEFDGVGELQFNIELHEIKKGARIGVFFGLIKSKIDLDSASSQLLVIQRDSENEYQLSLEYRKFNDAGGSRELGERALTIKEDHVAINLSITSEGLKNLDINDQNYYDLVTEARSKMPSPATGIGQFGLLCQTGNAAFANPVLNHKPRIFDSAPTEQK